MPRLVDSSSALASGQMVQCVMRSLRTNIQDCLVLVAENDLECYYKGRGRDRIMIEV